MIAVRDLEIAFGERVVARVPELDLRARRDRRARGRERLGQVDDRAGHPRAGALTRARACAARSALDGEELAGRPERELRRDPRPPDRHDHAEPARRRSTRRCGSGRCSTGRCALHGVRVAPSARRGSATRSPSVRLGPALLRRYPHEVSGGQAQRFAIALAVALRADVLLADEPTSALDVTVQAEVVELLRRVRDEHGTAILFISHDLAVLGAARRSACVVMRDGEVVESGRGPRRAAARRAAAYTRELRRRGAGDRQGPGGVSGLLERPRPARRATAARTVVRDVSLDGRPGPFGVGLIGESGSGKTTIARALLAAGARRRAARRRSTAATWRAARRATCGRTGARCRSSSRTARRRSIPRMRMRASIAEALRSTTSCPARGAGGPRRRAAGRGRARPRARAAASRTSSPAASASG